MFATAIRFYAVVRTAVSDGRDWLDYCTIARRPESACALADMMSMANPTWASENPFARVSRFQITELPLEEDTEEP